MTTVTASAVFLQPFSSVTSTLIEYVSAGVVGNNTGSGIDWSLNTLTAEGVYCHICEAYKTPLVPSCTGVPLHALWAATEITGSGNG